MKKFTLDDYPFNTDRKPAMTSTKVKNIFEAHRAGVAGSVSSEHKHAKCGCCSDQGKIVPILDANNDTVWDQNQYSFLSQKYDISGEHLRVHPALWNNGTNNVLSGVFEVLPGKIYQVRGYDMANITFVKSSNIKDEILSSTDRWIVMDTLMSTECTEAALKLFADYLAIENPGYKLSGNIVGMIISHSHVDHYGGMSKVKEYFISEDSITRKRTATGVKTIIEPSIPFILAPEGFFEHSVSENVYVGNAMGRRASYQYGSFIKPQYKIDGAITDDPNNYLSGEISIGIGQGQSTGTISFEVPTHEISENGYYMLDEIEVHFQLTPGTEAPAEMNTYYPDYKALWLAENCNGTLHNLYTLRGAQVRDGKAWAEYLVEAAILYGDKTDVIFQSHNWPHWQVIPEKLTNQGDVTETKIKEFLLDTAAIYKYINDQTLLYMNMGYKMNEAADMLTLPRKMQKNWCLKPFYGTPKHNSKAVYQKYLGWYDANPLHLEELPPEQLAQEQLRYMKAGGSEDNILSLVVEDIGKGNFWTAAYMAHQVVLGSNDSDKVGRAKKLCADALEQLGYQSESGTWRNAYLSAAYELRTEKGRVSAEGGGMFANMTTEMLLDYIAIFFDGERASSLPDYDGYISVDEIDYFFFSVRKGAVLYHSVVASNYEDMLMLERSNLLQIISGSYTKENIFGKISQCIIPISIDRYKYFDIMNRHDSEVSIDGIFYDLYTESLACFNMLQKYVALVDMSGKETISFTQEDMKLWSDFRDILVDETNLLLDYKFFNPSNQQAGIGTDGTFYAHELFYNLFCLLRYLYSPYIKNDFQFEGKETEVEAYVRIKERIKLLETYLPDCYLKEKDYYVEFESDDSLAWQYLCGENKERMSIAEFMSNLYVCYTVLAISVGKLEGDIPKISIDYLESSSKILLNYSLPDLNNYVLKCGTDVMTTDKAKNSCEVDVSNESEVSFIIYRKFSETEIPVCYATFKKPIVECSTSVRRTKQEVERLALENNGGFCELINIGTEADPIIAVAYEAPSRPINYTLYYSTQNVDKLIINEEEQQNVSSGSVTITTRSYSASFTVVGYSKCGFYVQQKVSCSG